MLHLFSYLDTYPRLATCFVPRPVQSGFRVSLCPHFFLGSEIAPCILRSGGFASGRVVFSIDIVFVGSVLWVQIRMRRSPIILKYDIAKREQAVAKKKTTRLHQ